jgi:hypothetical protein
LCAAKGNDPWRVFLRYQAQAERNYRSALEEFERLKALRDELPNEPTTTIQAESQSEENMLPSDAGAAAPQPLEPASPQDRDPLDPPSPQPSGNSSSDSLESSSWHLLKC